MRVFSLNPCGIFLSSESQDFMQNWDPDRETYDLMHSLILMCVDVSPVRYAKFESIRYFIDIDIFQNHHIDIDIDIDIFGIALSISISISIFSNMTISISISISIFFKSVDISTIDMSYRYIEQG